MIKGGKIIAYGCGSPIRLPLIAALAEGARADQYVPESNPSYRGGNSIIWGLIRGADTIMKSSSDAGFSFYQVDNAYFGREIYFRVTKNAVQKNKIEIRDNKRFLDQFKIANLSFEPWKLKRNGPIILCTSSEHLYRFYNTTMKLWIEETVLRLRQYTDRPIALREKQIGGIEDVIRDAWCVVTHSSAAALDALRLGIPVITTADCAASPLSTRIEHIENPKMNVSRSALFSSLSYGQFTVEEFKNGYAWDIVK